MTTLAVIGILIAVASIVALYTGCRWAVVAAYIALFPSWIASANGLGDSASTLIFWGIAALIVIGINIMLGKKVSKQRIGLGYIVTATVAGALIGIVLAPTWMVLGAVIGAFFGALAFSRTPAGRHLEFPSSQFIAYLCAKGLPTVVTVAIAAIASFRAVSALQVL